MISVLVLLFFFFKTTTIHNHGLVVLAYPTGAGSCNAGDPMKPVGHPTDAMKGSLEDGNFQLTLNDQVVLSEGGSSSMIVSTNEENIIKLSGKDSITMFRGFLLRVSSDEIDLTGTLSNPKTTVDYQIRLNKDEVSLDDTAEEDNTRYGPESLCDSRVAAATHTADSNNNAYDKNSVEVVWDIPSDAIPPNNGGIINIEVTAVVQYSQYYYTKYVVTAEDVEENSKEKEDSSGGSSRHAMVMMMMPILLLQPLFARP